MPKKKPTEGYPYTILPFVNEKFSQPNPLCVNIFFLGETLLRSEKVMDAYRQGDEAFRTCLKQLGLRYDPLTGDHHVVMRMDTTTAMQQNEFTSAGFVDDGILDLKAYAKFKPSGLPRTGGMAASLNLLRDTDPRFLCLRLDAACTPTALIERLRDILTKRHEQVKDAPFKGPFAKYYRAFKTPFRSVKAWLQYFQCYDLKRNKGLTSNQVAEQIYGTEDDAVNKTQQAIKRVKAIILSAEANCWPPKGVR